MRALLFAAALVLAWSPMPAGSSTIEIAPTADAFVLSADPTGNYGGAGALHVAGVPMVGVRGIDMGVADTFIRFNTGGVVARFDNEFGASGWNLSRLVLNLTEDAAPRLSLFKRGVGQFEVRWLASDDWVEGTGRPISVTANGVAFVDELDILDGGSDLPLGVFSNTGVNGPVTLELPIPPDLEADIRSGGDVTLFLSAIDMSTGFTFYSRSVNLGRPRPMLAISAEAPPALLGDVNGDDIVNVADLLIVRNNLGNTGSNIFPPTADVSPTGAPDGVVNVADLLFVRNRLGDGGGF